MNTFPLLFLIFIFLLSGCNSASELSNMDSAIDNNVETKVLKESPNVNSPVILLKFKPSYITTVESIKEIDAKGFTRSGISSLDSLLQSMSVSTFERVFPINKFEKRTRLSDLHLWYRVTTNKKIDLSRFTSQLVQTRAFSTIEVPAKIQNANCVQSTLSSFSNLNTPQNASHPFNDPLIDKQWNFYNDGMHVYESLPSADINLYEAWKRSTGDPNVIVAVIDEYVDATHPDLEKSMWKNEAEINGKAGIDDDNNGYIDDYHGFNFRTMSSNAKALPHGTHVAGVIGATNNNGIGVASVAGGSGRADGVRLMTCGVMDLGGGTVEEIALGIKYAADNGAVIAQNSWGYPDPYLNWKEDTEYSIQREAFDYFLKYAGKNEKNDVIGPLNGGLVVFAAGNNGQIFGNKEMWPAADPRFVAVSAIGPDFRPSYYTNYGGWIDITAPGGDRIFNKDEGQILSTTLDYNSGNPNYGYMEGTSMACPQVSGIAALAVSYAKQKNYIMTNEELKDVLLSSCRDISSYFTGKKVHEGYNAYTTFNLNMDEYIHQMGTGLIDANKVLDQVDELLGFPSDYHRPHPIDTVTIIDQTRSTLTLQWKLTGDYKKNPLNHYNVYYSLKPITQTDLLTLKDISYVSVKVSQNLTIGDDVKLTLTDLIPDSHYYMAVIGYDRYTQSSNPCYSFGNTLKNQNPVITPSFTTPVCMQYWEKKSFTFKVTDKENDSWKAFIHDDPSNWILKYDTSTISLDFVGPTTYKGKNVISLEVSDSLGGSTIYPLEYEILPNQVPELIKPITDMYIESIHADTMIKLNEYFYDPNLENLMYLIKQNGNSIKTLVRDTKLNIHSLKNGLTELTIIARDNLSESVSATFKIMVRDTNKEIELYPNPVKDFMYIRMGKNVRGKIQVTIRGNQGNVLKKVETEIAPFEPAIINMSSISKGKLWIEVTYQGEKFKGNVIKL